jgi:hypothetical protein
MFFYRNRVSEPHLNKYAGWLHQQYLSGKSEQVAQDKKQARFSYHKTIDMDSRESVFFMVDTSLSVDECPRKPTRDPHPAVLGFCSLGRMPRWVALETSMLYVSPLARGHGVASAIYSSIMMDGNIVISGYSHNPKSRRLWMKMIENPNYVVWAHDLIDLNRYADVVVEDGKIECQLKIYEDIKKIRRRRRQDVRFVAYNPRYVK